jgi:hypothetical protein
MMGAVFAMQGFGQVCPSPERRARILLTSR